MLSDAQDNRQHKQQPLAQTEYPTKSDTNKNPVQQTQFPAIKGHREQPNHFQTSLKYTECK